MENLTDKSDDLLQKVREFESKLSSVQAIKDQFPIDELRSRKTALQDLESTLKDLQHAKDLEKQLLESQKKLSKKLEPCDCFEHLPTCEYVKNSDKHKKQIDKQIIKHDEAKVVELAENLKTIRTAASRDRSWTSSHWRSRSTIASRLS